ncbi:MAG: hypothetical protein IT544_05480 [Rhodobacteraceae bacterium]|nr:hypothetical protein [Paracoccaceae bacterium]
MATRRFGRVYGVTGTPMVEALPLIIAFSIGIFGVVLLKVIAAPFFLSAVFAAVILFAYVVIAYFATAFRLDSETIGDNAYYLGFLFTLTSLAVTLYFVVEAAPKDRVELIPEIISGFGVALSSTIVGVFLRVVMLQLKVDVVSREKRARTELDEAARRFRTELGSTLERIKSFSTESVQQAAEREGKMKVAFDTLMADMQSELLKSAQEFGPAIRESVRIQTEVALSQVLSVVKDASASAATGMSAIILELSSVAKEISVSNVDAARDVLSSLEKLKESADALIVGTTLTTEKFVLAQQNALEFSATLAKGIDANSMGVLASISNAQDQLTLGSQSYLEAALKVANQFEEATSRVSEGFEENTRTLLLANVQTANFLKTATDQLESCRQKCIHAYSAPQK